MVLGYKTNARKIQFRLLQISSDQITFLRKMCCLFNGWSIKYEKTAQWVCIIFFFKKTNQLATFMYDVQNPLRAAIMEMSNETTSLFAFKSVVLHFKDTQIFGIKNCGDKVTWFLSEEITKKGEEGRRRPLSGSRGRKSVSGPNPLQLRFSPSDNKSTTNAFIKEISFHKTGIFR